MPVNSYTLQFTMDTDYGLPIPMHRLSISLDATKDRPLPFHRRLEQVTKLTAENTTPYQLPKERRLSAVEKLPFEIRERIYSYVPPCIETYRWYSLLYGPNETKLWDHQSTWYHDSYNDRLYDLGLYAVSRGIRSELLDTWFRSRVVRFQHPVSNKKLFYNNWSRVHCARERER
jgi:hypothetical protein